MSNKGNLLEVRNLQTHFRTGAGIIKAVNGVSFELKRGETLGVVGESGCGKSVTSFSIMRLIPSPPGKIVGGEIMYNDRNLLALSEPQMRSLRGNDISMIFQEPMTSLNPVFTCGSQIAEAIMKHSGAKKKEAMEKSVELLKMVGIPLPEKRVHEYPYQLSGGMRQRVMIAMALSSNPNLLIADEPTTALDVTIQAQILELLKRLRKELDMSILLITHDLGVIVEMAERVIVMYLGKVVEEADVKTLFRETAHPYTLGLMKSIPKIETDTKRLHIIEGMVPKPGDSIEGCSFHPRCPFADERCRAEVPPLETVKDDHRVACWNYRQVIG